MMKKCKIPIQLEKCKGALWLKAGPGARLPASASCCVAASRPRPHTEALCRTVLPDPSLQFPHLWTQVLEMKRSVRSQGFSDHIRSP